MNDDASVDGKPVYDDAKAASLLGKYILVGLTINDHNNNFIEQKQYHGIVTGIDEIQGFTLILKGIHDGEVLNLPPYLENFNPANPGTYSLRSTKEEIENPDYTSTWTITNPPNQ